MTAEAHIDTYLPVRVGRSGTKVHDLHASARWNARKGTVSIYTGQTYCGSQRFGSGWYAVDPATMPTCQRCGTRARHRIDFVRTNTIGDLTVEFHSNPLDVVIPRGSTLTPTAEVIEKLTPGPDEQCRDRDYRPVERIWVRCSRTTHSDSPHVYDGQKEDR